jgi:ankyrin repeat protein
VTLARQPSWSRHDLFAEPFGPSFDTASNFDQEGIVDDYLPDVGSTDIISDVEPNVATTPVSISGLASSLSRERTNSMDESRLSSSIDNISNSLTPRYSSPFSVRVEEGARNKLNQQRSNDSERIIFESIEELKRLIIEACCLRKGKLETVQRLVESGVENGSNESDLINFTKLHSSSTPLHYAVSRNNLEIVQWLVTHGANIEKEDEQGEVSESS